MRFYSIAIAAMTLVISSPSFAKSWPETGGWTIGEVDDGCGMMQEYEGKGETQLYLFLTLEGRVFLTLSNYAWSAVKNEKYDLEFYLNGIAYSGSPSIGVGEKYESRKGFATQMAPTFINDFAKGTGLKIYRGETVVDHLDLKGTSVAVTMLQRCVAHVKAEKEAADREKRRLAYISDDPFSVERTDEEIAASPSPRGNPAAWVTLEDYPLRALREERQGTTSYELTISPAGLVTDCKITVSSGHVDLDSETCRLLMRRARFGSSQSGGTYNGKTVWKLPG